MHCSQLEIVADCLVRTSSAVVAEVGRLEAARPPPAQHQAALETEIAQLEAEAAQLAEEIEGLTGVAPESDRPWPK